MSNLNLQWAENWLIKSKPSKNLNTCIKKLNKKQTIQRLTILGISFDESSKKEPLTEALLEEASDSENLKDLITWADSDQRNILTALCDSYYMEFVDLSLIPKFKYLIETGLVHLFKNDERLYIGIQNQTIDALNALDDNARIVMSRLKTDIIAYLRAAGNLYGAIQLDNLYSLYKRHHAACETVISKEVFFDLAYASQVRHENYWLYEDVLYSTFFEDALTLKDLIKEILNPAKPYYLPGLDDFLHYTSHELNATLPASDALVDRIQKNIPGNLVDFKTDLKYVLEFLNLEGFFNYLNQIGYIAPSNEELNVLKDLFIVAQGQTRSWVNHGFTFDELSAIKPQTAKVTKIGRNEKCPCQSGKKYKHCCGK
ncbi:SEC-C metal-binding domain-containing protein [Fusibacter sp. JL298sf-3]